MEKGARSDEGGEGLSSPNPQMGGTWGDPRCKSEVIIFFFFNFHYGGKGLATLSYT